jgi:hypothetical protein
METEAISAANTAMLRDAETLANDIGELMDGHKVIVALIALGAVFGSLRDLAGYDTEEMLAGLRRQIGAHDLGENICSALATLN